MLRNRRFEIHIGSVFLLDQEIDSKEYRNRLLGIAPILRKFNTNNFQLFKSWLKVISSANLPEQAKQEIIRIIDESTPEEVEKMVTNMERTLGNIYDEGKNDGLIAGEIKGKIDDAKKMLAENMSEDLIVKITGLPVEQIRKIKSELH